MIETISELAQTALIIVLSTLATALTAYVIRVWQTQKLKFTKEQETLLDWICNTAVWSVEQAYLSGIIPKAMRLEKAIEYVQEQVSKLGIEMDITEIVIRIESAIATEINRDKHVSAEKE